MTDRSRLAIDIGGTFTDVVYSDPNGRLLSAKVPTTTENITNGIIDAIRKVNADPSSLRSFVHGTTIALNALLEGKTGQIGLITTKGFRDVLEIMRTNRPDMYDLQQEKPIPLVPRRWRYEISARMTYTGETLVEVDVDEVRKCAREFATDEIDSIAICLLHSYANPEHEKAVEAVVRDVMPNAAVSLSSDLSRVWREFERTSTVVINAATKPIVSRYLENLEKALKADGYQGEVLIMQSNGGVMSGRVARDRPVATLMSGPIGGVTGATSIAHEEAGGGNLVTLDIGGTSADVAIVDRGAPVTKDIGHVGRWPVMVPMVDIEAIGAGGGSIARVDSFGGLAVGPDSAGADPGPACYGRGGTEATVTDANVVLGRINPEYFLGGELRLDVSAARKAIREHVGDPYGMTCEEAAQGIVAVVNSNMIRLLWEVMVGRGYDPRDFSLLAYGGAGPLHAAELAHTLGIREVIVPVDPGTFSALGILTADVRYDYDRMLIGSSPSLTATEMTDAFSHLEKEARARMETEVASYTHIEIVRSAELRYSGQDHALLVELPVGGAGDSDLLATCRDLFHAKHERLYGFRRGDAPVEVVRTQLSVFARLARQRSSEDGTLRSDQPKRRRPVFVEGALHETAVYERARLQTGLALTGPCVVEEPGSTTYVPPGFELKVSRSGTLHLHTTQFAV